MVHFSPMSTPPIDSTNASISPLPAFAPPQPQRIKPSGGNYSSSILAFTEYSSPTLPRFTHYSGPPVPSPQSQPIKPSGRNSSSSTSTLTFHPLLQPPFIKKRKKRQPQSFSENSFEYVSYPKNKSTQPQPTNPSSGNSSSHTPPFSQYPDASLSPTQPLAMQAYFAPQPFISTAPAFQPTATITPSYQIKQEYLDQYHPFKSQNQSMAVISPHYAKEALSDPCLLRNRYKDVIPYQKNIFKFQNRSLYFNASSVLQGRAISCQGPLENEHAHFWRMAWESKTTAIVMLTDLVEKGVNKCSWYLPTTTTAKLPPKFELPEGLEITVTQTDGPPKPTDSSPRDSIEIFQRCIELEYKGEKRIVLHYHLTGCGDFTVAPHVVLAKLVQLVGDRHFRKGEHIISHCSAGIGRSGTFLAILGALFELRNKPLLTNLVINVVRQLRTFEDGREGMVQTAEQYGLIFKTLAVLDPDCAREFCVQAPFS